jgi:ATP-binding cassette subfamily B multidrug efflux pump
MRATRKLVGFLRPYRLWAILAPLLMVLEVSMDLMQPRLVERIVDQGIVPGQMTVVARTGLLMVAAAALGLVGGMGCTVFAVLASQGFGADLRSTLFGRVQALSFGDLDRLETGALITRLTNDVTRVQDMVLTLLRILVRAPLLVVGSLLMAVLTSPQLAVLYVILIPVVSAMVVWVINRTFPMFGEVQRRLDGLNTAMQENLAGVRLVKAFVREAYERSRFHRVNEELTTQSVVAAQTLALTMPFMMLVLNTGLVAALWIGGVQVKAGGMEVGQVIAFINYLTMTLWSLVMTSMLVMQVSRAEASAARVQEVLDSAPEVQDRPDAVQVLEPGGGVSFEQVSFSYQADGHDAVLRDISFTARPGQTVALLGATGSGKSSLVSLIPRFYDVTGGRVAIDGVDVRDLDQTALRGRIGMALQESVLFTGTIRDNIRFGRPDATDEEVVAAAKAAQAHDFITGFPDGYDSVVGQRGVNLSGGQKQRIAIARALLIRPDVLILDDSTSAVDIETEARIQASLDDLNPGPTRFIVAQRISSVLNAELILVLDDGRIVAHGPHDELLVSSPIYREIYDSQMGNGGMIYGSD